MNRIKVRRYSELIMLDSLEDRYEYLRLGGTVGMDTFGFDRYMNQLLYSSPEWRSVRAKVIARDLGRDLGVEGYEIYSTIMVHHMNPITPNDIKEHNPDIFIPEFLISTSRNTHRAIHYSNASLLPKDPIFRSKHDTTPWRK